nr:putative ABC transporter permease [Desulfotomaculum nigrificans]
MVTARLLNDIAFLILVFAFYSLAGWILETTYRSVKQHHFVNPGLLKGPFLPIYGSFALIVILTNEIWPHSSWELAFVFFVFLSTIIEYLAGTLWPVPLLMDIRNTSIIEVERGHKRWQSNIVQNSKWKPLNG